jgi:hypothetical protein
MTLVAPALGTPASGVLTNCTGTASGLTAGEATTLTGLTSSVAELNFVKNVTSAIQTQLDAKSALAGPTFTGTPAAPTAASGTATTQIATTAFVTSAVSDLIGGAPGALDTLNELAAAIDDDASYAASITTSLGGKQATLTGATSTLVSTDLTVSRALASDANGKIVVSDVTSTELGYLDGVTSAIQTQIDGKQATLTGATSALVSSDLTASRALASDSNGKIGVSDITSTELGFLDGVTSAIQTQIDAKQATLSSSNKLSGDSIEIAATSAIKDNSGLAIKDTIAGTGLTMSNQVLDLDATQSFTSVTTGTVQVSTGKISHTDGSTVTDMIDIDASKVTISKRLDVLNVGGAGFRTKLTDSNPSQDIDIILPSGTGTLALISNIPTVDTTITNVSSNAITSNAVFAGLATKQNSLTQQSHIDNAASSQAVASGGVANDGSTALDVPTKAEFDGLRTDVQNLTTKVNAILTALEALGLVASS